MDFSRSIKAFLVALPLGELNGHQKFLAVASHLAEGRTYAAVKVADVSKNWSKSILRVSFHSAFYSRADEAGWVKPCEPGVFTVSQEGLDHLDALFESKRIAIDGTITKGLHIFDKTQTHSFDKFLRGVLSRAQKRVLIADSYVDETIFDTVLDVIPPGTQIHLLHNSKQGSYDARAKRFLTQYRGFVSKQYKDLHDRFFIVDDAGYVIGPSIKDAARKSPALLISLDAKDSAALANFFQLIWARGS